MVDTGGLGEEWFNRSHVIAPDLIAAAAEINDVVELVTSRTDEPDSWSEMEETLEIVSQGRVECMLLFIKPLPFSNLADQSLTTNNVCSNRNTRF